MKILVSPNAFKECLSAPEVANFIEEGIRRVISDADIVKCPVADGGDGFVEVLEQNLSCRKISVSVSDPLFRRINTDFLFLPDKKTAIIELAKASGLALLKPDEQNVMQTSTFGTGELIKKALDMDVSRIYLGVGGSATCEGGIGILNAKLEKGIDIVIELLEIEKKIKNADLVFTGEGKIDNQTAFGKAPAGIAALAKKYNIPCIAIAGIVGENIENLYSLGISSIFSISKGSISIQESIRNAKRNISDTAEQIMRSLIKT